MSVIAPGTQAPSFRLQRENGERFTEQDLRGETTILVFYPFAFSPVCTDQLGVYQEALDELTANGETVYGVSCDSSYAQKAFREKLGVSIPQLSDFEPKGAACTAFGVLRGRVRAARARDRRPRRGGALELSGALAGGAAGRGAAARGPGRSLRRRGGLTGPPVRHANRPVGSRPLSCAGSE